VFWANKRWWWWWRRQHRALSRKCDESLIATVRRRENRPNYVDRLRNHLSDNVCHRADVRVPFVSLATARLPPACCKKSCGERERRGATKRRRNMHRRHRRRAGRLMPLVSIVTSDGQWWRLMSPRTKGCGRPASIGLHRVVRWWAVWHRERADRLNSDAIPTNVSEVASLVVCHSTNLYVIASVWRTGLVYVDNPTFPTNLSVTDL